MLAGHEGYLTQNYRNYPKKQALDEYLKAVKMVTFEMPQDVKEMQTRFEKDLSETNQLVKSIVIENQQLKQELFEIKEEQKRLRAVSGVLQNLLDSDKEAQTIFNRLIKTKMRGSNLGKE